MRRHWAALPEQLPQRTAVHEFHDEEDERAVLALVEDVDQVRVRELRDCPCLPLEAGAESRIGGKLRVHDFHRDLTVQASVHGMVDRRHSALGDLGAQVIAVVEVAAGLRFHHCYCR